jgi:flagellar biosynthesis protein FlhB
MTKSMYKALIAVSIVVQTLMNYLFYLDRLTRMPVSEALSISLGAYFTCLVVGVGTMTIIYYATKRNRD